MKEIVETALAEMEAALEKAVSRCRDEYELYALTVGIAAAWDSLSERVFAKWSLGGSETHSLGKT